MKDKTESQKAKKESRESSIHQVLSSPWLLVAILGPVTMNANSLLYLLRVSCVTEPKLCRLCRLSLNPEALQVLLKNMVQEKPVSTHLISGMEVAVLKGNTLLKLPEVYPCNQRQRS